MTEKPIHKENENAPPGKAVPAAPRSADSQVLSPGHCRVMETVLAHTPMMAAFLDPQFNFIWVNRAYAEACRQPPSFFPGKNHFDLYPNDENQAIFQRVVDTGQPFSVKAKSFEYHDQPERGVTYWDWDLIPDKDAAGNVTGLIFTLVEVTKQFRDAEALKASEERFRLAFQTSPDSINLNRLEDGMYIDINQGFTRIMGYAHEEVVGQTSLSLNIWKDPRDRERLTDGLRKNGYVENLEARFVAKDGTVKDGLMSARILSIHGEKVILSITRDITNRKKIDCALQRRAEFDQLAATIVSELAGTAHRNFDSAIDQALATLGAAIGADRAYVFQFHSGHSRMDNTHEWCAEGIDPQIDNLKNISVQEALPWFDRQIRSGEVMRVPRVASLPPEAAAERAHFEVQGIQSLIVFPLKTTGALMGFLGFDAVRKRRDWGKDHQSILKLVSEAFSHVIERHHKDQALRESEAKYRILVENANDAILIAQDERIKFPNRKTERLTGYTTEELKRIPFADLIHPMDRATVTDRYRHRINGEDPVSEYTFRIFHKSGTEKTVQLNTIRVQWEGRPATLNFIRDITHQVELESRLIQSQKMESIGTLAGGVAHDFNNILFPIVGLSELLTEDLPPDSLEHENAREILKAAKRGRDLTRQILAFSRHSEPRIKPVRIQNIVKEALKLARSTIPADIEIAQDIQSDCGLLMADPTQLHQILMNLITNAYHAVAPNGGTITVRLKETVLTAEDLKGHALAPGPYARISVADTGCGMDFNMLNKIFEPYFTTKAQGKGTGLGLAVVYGIVRKHKGAVTVHSEGGKGAVFNVYLPLMADRTEPAPANGEDNREAGNERILLVDDEAAIVRVVTQMLERLGYDVTACTSSVGALEVFRKSPGIFDLVITDMTMPNMTGDQLTRELISVRPGIPVIISTGFSERINKNRAAELGVRGVLMKPVDMSEMARVVRKVLDARLSSAPRPPKEGRQSGQQD